MDEKPGQVRGPGRGDRGLLVGAAGAHLDHRAAAGGGDHAGGARGDRAVVVEDRQDQRLQHHALGEGAADGEDRRAGEEQLALGVAVDVAGEAVAGQPRGRRGVDDPARRAGTRRPASENLKSGDLDQPPGPGDDAVTPARRQAAGEHLEDATRGRRSRRAARPTSMVSS